MSNKTDFQAKNARLNANNADLSSILATINNLPEAGSGSGKMFTGGKLVWTQSGEGIESTTQGAFLGTIEVGKTYEFGCWNLNFEESVFFSGTAIEVEIDEGITTLTFFDETSDSHLGQVVDYATILGLNGFTNPPPMLMVLINVGMANLLNDVHCFIREV